VPIETEPTRSKHDLVVLLALLIELETPSGCQCTRASSYQALRGQNTYDRLPSGWLALSVLGGYTSNAASEARGCHSTAPHWQAPVDPQMIVCLRDGKEAVEQLKAIYPDEAKNAELAGHHG
jgi:hypothetical protein